MDTLTDNGTVKSPKPTVPFTLVIFGIPGDLNKRLLFPSICNLGGAGLLDSNFHVVGLGVDSFTNETFRDCLKQDIKQFVVNPESQKFGLSIVNSVDYIQGDFADAGSPLVAVGGVAAAVSGTAVLT